MADLLIPISIDRKPRPGEIEPAELSGREMLVANVDGVYHAFARRCPHEDADLLEGELIDCQLRCDNHSYVFDLTSGECVAPPGAAQLTVFPVDEKDGQLFARLG